MANKIYKVDEATVTWSDTTGDLAMTNNNLAAGAGRQGAQKDLGAVATARTRTFRWRANTRFATTPVVGEVVRLYIKTGDGTYYDNDDGTGDIALSAEDKLKNLEHIGNIVVDEAATGVDIGASGTVEIGARYVMPVWFNDTADNLVASNDVSKFILIPEPVEVQ